MKMIEQLDSIEAKNRLVEVNAWVQQKPQKYAVEYYSSFEAFISALQAALTELKAAVDTTTGRQNEIARARLNYAAAIYRDCKYSLMHRGRLQELGINNMFREAYEVGRIAKLNGD
jgi:hypothetical protein